VVDGRAHQRVMELELVTPHPGEPLPLGRIERLGGGSQLPSLWPAPPPRLREM
jgi:hypothetical protein